MTPQEFLSLGLTPGTRVTLSLRPPSGKLVFVKCFFRGYSVTRGRTIIDEYSINPDFVEPTAKGRMGKKLIPYFTTFDHIDTLRVEEGIPETPVGRKENAALAGAREIITRRTDDTIRAVASEMTALFPGRTIRIPREDWIRCTAHIDGWDQVGVIRGITKTANGLKCYLVDLGPDTITVPFLDATVHNPSALLKSMYEQIAYPFDNEYENKDEENFIPESATQEDIPDTETVSKLAPFLDKQGVIEDLRENIWFRSMDAKQLREEFAEMKEYTSIEKDEDFKFVLRCWWLNEASGIVRSVHYNKR